MSTVLGGTDCRPLAFDLNWPDAESATTERFKAAIAVVEKKGRLA
jgi:hypothetical protein